MRTQRTRHCANTPVPDHLCCSELAAGYSRSSGYKPEGTGQQQNGSALYKEWEGSLTPSSKDKGKVSSSLSKKAANHSHAGTRPPAQPEGVHLGMFDPSHKDTRTGMGVSAFPWQRGLHWVRWQPTISAGAPVSGLHLSLLGSRASHPQAQVSRRAVIRASPSAKWVASSSFVKNAANPWLRSKRCHSPGSWWQLVESSVFDRKGFVFVLYVSNRIRARREPGYWVI